MERAERKQLLRDIELERKSRLLVYITGDRAGLETRIGLDTLTLIFQHLRALGDQEKIDLFIYSPGGITIAGYSLVNREFCKTFGVIIPFKALSTATLIALGADEIIMTKMAQLSPVDPSVSSPLGPAVQIPGQQGVRNVPVNVEDVISFLQLAKDEAGIRSDESIARVFEKLASSVHPLMLGSVNRAREQISFLSRILLSYHIKNNPDKITKIVDTLTRERFSHGYLIGKREAKEVIGLNVLDVSSELDSKIVELYNEYERMLELNNPYNPDLTLAGKQAAEATFNRAIIESSELTHVFGTVREIRRVQIPPQPQMGVPVATDAFQERTLSENWVRDDLL